ncbi:hypothetical protein [Streptomyces inhibens]|uniref:hypothetical protein n=1 Tax=Streptomyces inhibens TaxID=2293571 RepID=UPI0015F26685|nr:hypothetical protein [Streptomyces inhibens]
MPSDNDALGVDDYFASWWDAPGVHAAADTISSGQARTARRRAEYIESQIR